MGVRRKKFEIESQIRDIVEKLDKSSASERLLERLDMLRYDAQLHENTVTIKQQQPDRGQHRRGWLTVVDGLVGAARHRHLRQMGYPKTVSGRSADRRLALGAGLGSRRVNADKIDDIEQSVEAAGLVDDRQFTEPTALKQADRLL